MPDSVSSATNNAALDAANAAGTVSKSLSKDALGKLGSDAFLKLLVAQLRYQNPFSPSDPTAMLGQVAQFTQVEALQKIQASQTSSQSLEQARMASEVIGRNVTGTDAAGSAITGVVSSARFTPTGPMLVLANGKEMPLANMESMAAGSATAASTASTASTPAASSSSSSSSSSTSSGSSDSAAASAKTSAPNATGSSSSSTTSSGSSSTSSNGSGSATSSQIAAAASSAGTPAPSGTVRDVVAEITAFAASNLKSRTLQPAGLAS